MKRLLLLPLLLMLLNSYAQKSYSDYTIEELEQEKVESVRIEDYSKAAFYKKAIILKKQLNEAVLKEDYVKAAEIKTQLELLFPKPLEQENQANNDTNNTIEPDTLLLNSEESYSMVLKRGDKSVEVPENNKIKIMFKKDGKIQYKKGLLENVTADTIIVDGKSIALENISSLSIYSKGKSLTGKILALSLIVPTAIGLAILATSSGESFETADMDLPAVPGVIGFAGIGTGIYLMSPKNYSFTNTKKWTYSIVKDN